MFLLNELLKKEKRRVVGLMSGTSADAVDAVLVEFTGVGADTRFESEIRSQFPDARLLMDLPLPDLADEMKQFAHYAGNDTGITHLAAACGLSVTALFGPTDPEIWAPRGDHVRVLRPATLREITVDDVLTAIRRK